VAAVHDEIEAMPMGFTHTLIGDMGAALSAVRSSACLLAPRLYKRPKICCSRGDELARRRPRAHRQPGGRQLAPDAGDRRPPPGNDRLGGGA
jgi:hypothetical protein